MDPGVLARVVYSFASSIEGELSLSVGSVVQVIRKVDRHWTYGCCEGRFGNFPTGFIAEMSIPSYVDGEQLFVAKDCFAAQELEDLAFQKGDVIVGTQVVDDNWWRGKMDSCTGIFPLNLVWKVDMSLLPTEITKKGKVDMRATVNTDLKAQLKEEIDLKKGDIVKITEIVDKDWYRGECKGNIGIFPSAFVTLMEGGKETSSLPDLLNFEEINGKPTGSSDLLTSFDPLSCDSEQESLPPPSIPPPQLPMDIPLLKPTLQGSNEPQCITVYAFTGEFSNELSFGVGQLVRLVRRIDSQWLEGELNGKIGLFPSCYVHVLVDLPILPMEYENRIQENLTHGKSAIAMYDFNPQMDGDLGLREGELVTVLQRLGDSWYKVQNSKGLSGLCPASYLQLLECGTSASNMEYFQRQLSLPSWSRTSKEKERENSVYIKYSVNRNIPKLDNNLTDKASLHLQTMSSVKPLRTNHSIGVSSTSVKPFAEPKENITIDTKNPTVSYLQESGRRYSCPASSAKRLPPPRPPSFTIANLSGSPRNEGKVQDRVRVPHRPAPPVPVRACRPTSAIVTPTFSHQCTERRPNRRAMSEVGARSPGPTLVSNPETTLDAVQSEVEQCQLQLYKKDLHRADSTTSLFESKERKIEKQKLILEELLQTEKSFVQDMQFCKNAFLSNPEECMHYGLNADAVFSQIEPVLKVNKQLLNSLQDAMASPVECQKIGICFTQIAPEMKKAYSDYCANHNEVILLLEKYEENEEISKFIQTKLGDGANPSYFNLSSVLIKPVQRILKYPLLLNELVKTIDDSFPDKLELTTALHVMTDVANEINECKRRKDLVVKYRKDSDSGLTAKISKLNLHSVVKKGHRIGMRLSSHLGLVSVTKDHAFDDTEQKFRDLEKTIKQLLKDADAFHSNLKECVTAQFQLGEHIGDFYEEQRCRKDVDSFRTIQRDIMSNIWPEFERIFESRLKKPLTELLHLYEGPNNLMEKRNDKLLDYDGASQRLERNKDINKGKQLRDEMEVTKKDYSALNAQLLEELPKLTDLSIAVVAECVGAFLFARRKFIGMTAKHLVTMTEEVPNLNLPDKDILDSFMEKHEAILERMKDSGMTVLQPSPRMERAVKDKGYSEKHKSASLTVGTSTAKQSMQSTSQRAYLQGRYTAEQLFRALQTYKPANDLELSLRTDELVAVIKQKDPMGLTNRWFVDNGVDKGLVPAHILTPLVQLNLQQQEILKPPASPGLPKNDVEMVPSEPPPKYSYYDTVPEETDTQLRYDNFPWEGYHSSETNEGRYDEPCDFPFPEVQEEEVDGFAVVNMENASRSACNDPTLHGAQTIQVDDVENAYYVATYPFQARGPHELSIVHGQVVLVHHQQDLEGNPEWWFVEDRYGNEGYAPASYLSRYQGPGVQ